mmetsp:Transcript_218/g.274  ORF Transcript_218/g.274 Transcript_218/m.274 type:complete len:144 (-) Transcript_218:293-724(-)
MNFLVCFLILKTNCIDCWNFSDNGKVEVQDNPLLSAVIPVVTPICYSSHADFFNRHDCRQDLDGYQLLGDIPGVTAFDLDQVDSLFKMPTKTFNQAAATAGKFSKGMARKASRFARKLFWRTPADWKNWSAFNRKVAKSRYHS